MFPENITPATSVTFGDDESKNATWQKLEELIVSEASVNGNGGSMLASKPTVQCFTNKTNNTVNPVGLVNGKQLLWFSSLLYGLLKSVLLKNYCGQVFLQLLSSFIGQIKIKDLIFVLRLLSIVLSILTDIMWTHPLKVSEG